MYANGGWNEEKPVNKKESLTALRKTLQVYYCEWVCSYCFR